MVKLRWPTNTQLSKKNDGNAIWKDFVKKSISLLKPEGYLCYIVPSLWMKPDKAKMYGFLTQFKITKLHTMTNTETNQLFSGKAATPTCYFVLQNKKTDGIIELYDKDKRDYINFSLKPDLPIPVFGAHIINKILPFTEKVGDLKVTKITKPANYMDTSITISKTQTQDCPFPNVRTCKLVKNVAQLEINYTNKRLKFTDKKKIILAHKMYGFPYIDEKGEYGISNCDNFIILDKTLPEMRKIRDFLSTKFALYLFEATRYRMKFLERYVFEYIPDITKIEDFPEVINDNTIANYFGITAEEQEYINKLHTREYTYFRE